MIKRKFFGINNNLETLHTEISFLGIKFKYYNKRLYQSINYEPVLEKVRLKFKNQEKIKVAFLVSEHQKWNADELYSLLVENPLFEPVVLVTLLNCVHKGMDKTRNNLSKSYEFFKKRGMQVFKAYDEDNKNYVDLESFDIDILFYQQPWDLPINYQVPHVSQFALTCYFSYGVSLFETGIDYSLFHENLFLYFVPNKVVKNTLKKYKLSAVDNMFEIGFPKLDVYKKIKEKSKKNVAKKTIIYAPHFAYAKDSVLKIGTFDKTGIPLLEFAQKHPEYNWVFRPHPQLLSTLVQDKSYGVEFTKKYFSAWSDIGVFSHEGECFDVFLNSNLLITDASSFLLEYLPSRQPIIRLENNYSIKLSSFGKKVVDGSYRIKSFKKFEISFEKLMNGEDSLKNKRDCLIAELNLEDYNSSQKIVRILESKIKGEDNA